MPKQMRIGIMTLLAAAGAPALVSQPAAQQLHGTVTQAGDPVPGVEVRLVNRQTRQEFMTRTDANGRYVFSGLPTGTFEVTVQGPGPAPAWQGVVSFSGAPMPFDIQTDLTGQAAPPPRPLPTSPRDFPVPRSPVPSRPPPPPPPQQQASTGPRQTGRAFLIKPSAEDSGYGLYSYVLFGSGPDDATRPRYESTIQAFLETLADVHQLAAEKVPLQRLNITYLPVQRNPGNTPPAAPNILEIYDYAMSETLLSKLPGGLRTQGPYIVSTLHPLSSAPEPGQFLYQDLSTVPPSLIALWIKQFIEQASQDRFWEASAIRQFALDLRTAIEVAALALPDVERAPSEWKSIMASLIDVK